MLLDGTDRVMKAGDEPMLWKAGAVHGFMAIELPAAILNVGEDHGRFTG